MVIHDNPLKTAMPDYTKGKIYKLIFKGKEDIYIGSTTQLLSQRLAGHKRSPTNEKVKALMDEVGKENVKIRLIEKWSCNDREELRTCEQFHIDQLKPRLNQISAWVAPPPYCEVCKCGVGSMIFHKASAAHHENEEKQIFEFFGEDFVSQIYKWRDDEREAKHGTPERTHLTRWRDMCKFQGFDSPVPFKFDETGYIMIVNYEGKPCYKKMYF